MEGKRLILPKRQQRSLRGALIAALVIVIGVVAVWGLQMKLTFDRFANARQETSDSTWQASLERLNEVREQNPVEKPAELTVIEEAVAEQVLEEQAKQEVLEQVKERAAEQFGSAPSDSPMTGGGGEAVSTGTVAGEQIEAEAN